MTTHVHYAVTLFSGWLQTRGSPGVGMVGLEHECHAVVNGRADCRIRIYPWSVDVEDVAEYLWRYRPPGQPWQRHIVVGYSYGGQAALDFCQALLYRGCVSVVGLYLCDPVRRWHWLPGAAGLTGLGKLVVPDDVECVWGVRRTGPRWSLARWLSGVGGGLYSPAGHPVVWRGSEVELESRVTDHRHIDEDSHFRRAVLKTVARLVGVATREDET